VDQCEQLDASQFARWAAEQVGWEVEIVKRSDALQGFVVQAHRRLVERTFGWWGGCRRLDMAYDYQIESSEAMSSAASFIRHVPPAEGALVQPPVPLEDWSTSC
jgi:transposase